MVPIGNGIAQARLLVPIGTRPTLRHTLLPIGTQITGDPELLQIGTSRSFGRQRGNELRRDRVLPPNKNPQPSKPRSPPQTIRRIPPLGLIKAQDPRYAVASTRS
jgi:hypothetical protein